MKATAPALADLVSLTNEVIARMVASGELGPACSPDVLTASSRLSELAIDSLAKASLLVSIEQRLGADLALALDDLPADPSLADIHACIGPAPTDNLAGKPAAGDAVEVAFNVMPGRRVTERATITGYAVEGEWITATFDREYSSEMARSPDHLIVVTLLVQTQKLAYLALCRHFGLPMDPFGPERLKIWPVNLRIQLPVLVTQRSGLRHACRIGKVTPDPSRPDRFMAEMTARCDQLVIEGDCVVYRIDAPSGAG